MQCREDEPMSNCTDDCMHPGRPHRAINCPDCGRLSAHSWTWEGYTQDGYFSEWGGTCSLHGHWRDGT